MAPYFMVLSVPSLLAISYRGRDRIRPYVFVLIVFVLFMGLRYQVGADWRGYEYLHWFLSALPLQQIVTRTEPLSMLLFWSSQKSGSGMLLSNLMAAAILMVGVMAFARRTANPWLAVVAATPYLIIAFGMSGIRQAMGVGIFLLLLSRWETWGLVKRSAGVLVAGLFHASALVTGLFVVATLRASLATKVAIGVPVLGLAYFATQRAEVFASAIESYQQNYLGDRIESGGSLFHIGLIMLPVGLGFLFRRKITSRIHDIQLLTYGSWGALCVLALNFVSTTAASRLTLYLYFLPMMVYPALAFKNRSATFIFVVAHFAILLMWFLFANNSFAHLPYRTVLF